MSYSKYLEKITAKSADSITLATNKNKKYEL